MYKKIKNHKKKIILGVVILLLITFRIFRNTENENNNGSFERIVNVSILETSGGFVNASLNTNGTVTSFQEAEIRAETTGNIISVPVRVGNNVFAGSVLANFDSIDARNMVSQAEAGLQAAEAQLNQLKRNSAGGSNAENIINQQNTLVQNALRNLMNTDLRAYPLDRADETRANPPIITGTYTGLEKGEYIIETYRSGALSGASFRVSGLEQDTQSINAFNNAVPLGTKGLQITFPLNDDSSLGNQRWVVPIPNTRSSQYAQALSAYESAVSARDLSLTQSLTNEDQIKSAEAAVNQAQASLRTAQNQLSRTSVRSPFNGEVVNVNVKVGDFVSAGSPIARVVNKTELYIKSFLSSSESRRVSIGNEVLINGQIAGTVTNIASGINPANGMIEIGISINEENNLISGEFVDIEIMINNEIQNGEVVLLPLQAVQPQLNRSVIYLIEDDEVKVFEVETGRIVGEFIEIISELPENAQISSSARGLRDGLKVNVR